MELVEGERLAARVARGPLPLELTLRTGTQIADALRERAAELLEKGYAVRDSGMPYIGIPFFEPLRSEPRYLDLLRRLELPS